MHLVCTCLLTLWIGPVRIHSSLHGGHSRTLETSCIKRVFKLVFWDWVCKFFMRARCSSLTSAAGDPWICSSVECHIGNTHHVFFCHQHLQHFGVSIDMFPVQFSQFVNCPNQVYEKTTNLPNFWAAVVWILLSSVQLLLTNPQFSSELSYCRQAPLLCYTLRNPVTISPQSGYNHLD